MALIGNITNRGYIQGHINEANGILTGVITNSGQLGGQVVGLRGLKGDKGDTGDTGATGNGIASVAKTDSSGLVDTYTITYTDGNTTTFTLTNGKDGIDGIDGKDGADGKDGQDGQDGHSPVVTANKVGDTTTIYVDGVAVGTIIDGVDGQDGKDGQDGQDGADGYSPSASVSKVGTTATITITDKDGTTTAEIHDGSSGGASAFIAEYGVTTYADVKDAYDEDAIILCTVDDSGNTVICQLAYYDDANEIFYFAQPQSDGFYLAIIGSDDTWDDSYFTFASTDTATQLRDGLMSALDWQKLDGIESGAEVNVNADWDAVSGDAQILNKPTIPTKTSDLNNDSGFITGMTILSYGSSTWNDFITAYNANKVVYCRASSNANPASGTQGRLAFMAYVNNATTPTEVEFQYYRSIATHSASQQGDEVFVYKLTSSSGGTWSVTTREAASKIAAGSNMSSAYSSGTLTLSADLSSKQDTLVSGTNIKTINNTSLLGSGDISVAVGGTPIPSASDVAEFDSSAHMNSTDMTSQQVEDFVDELDIGASGLLNMFYPVGSIYQTVDDGFNPNIRWGGTWELIEEGRFLQATETSATGGDTVPAGLPNITGVANTRAYGEDSGLVNSASGALYATGQHNYKSGFSTTWATNAKGIGFDASKSNSIYGNSATVQPPAIKVYMWHRTA